MEEFLGRGSGEQSTLIARGIAALIVAVVAAALTIAQMRGTFDNTVEVSATIDDVGGSLVPGADVKMRGVLVGNAVSMELTPEGVSVTLALKGDSAKSIPADVRARVLPATVFGTSYVDLVVTDQRSNEVVQAGQQVAQDTSRATLELQTTLDSIHRVVSAVKPAELATTLGAISQALEGRGVQIGESIEQLVAYLSRLNPHIGLIREDLQLLADNLETLDRVAPDLFAAVEDGLTPIRTIAQKHDELTSILTGGSALVAEAEQFLSAEEQPLIDSIRQTAVVVDAFYDERASIAPGFRAFVKFGRRATTALSSGPFLDTDTRIITGNALPYTAADCPRYADAYGDNCTGALGAGADLPSTTAVQGADADDALIKELKDKLAQFDDLPRGGIAELLSRPLIGEIR